MNFTRELLARLDADLAAELARLRDDMDLLKYRLRDDPDRQHEALRERYYEYLNSIEPVRKDREALVKEIVAIEMARQPLPTVVVLDS